MHESVAFLEKTNNATQEITHLKYYVETSFEQESNENLHLVEVEEKQSKKGA